jgi:hypothetical protein
MVFAQFRVCEVITRFLCKRFDSLLDELDEFASNLFQTFLVLESNLKPTHATDDGQSRG